MANVRRNLIWGTKTNLMEENFVDKNVVENFSKSQNFKDINEGNNFVEKNNISNPHFKNKTTDDCFACGN